MVNAWALVPRVGTPCRRPASRFEVPGDPELHGDRAAGHRRLLVRAAAAELHDPAVTGRVEHPRRRRGDRRVVVEHAEQEGLEDHRLGEGGLDGQHRFVRQVHLAVPEGRDVPGELAPRRHCRVPACRSPGRPGGHDGVVEAEGVEQLHGAPHAPDHPVPPPRGQPAREQLEHAASVADPGLQGGVEHRQLVVVGEQGSRVRDVLRDRECGTGRGGGSVVVIVTGIRIHRDPGV